MGDAVRIYLFNETRSIGDADCKSVTREKRSASRFFDVLFPGSVDRVWAVLIAAGNMLCGMPQADIT